MSDDYMMESNQEILQQIKYNKQEFPDFVEAEWNWLCLRTSKHIILDQHYIVKLPVKPQIKVMSELDEVDDRSQDNHHKTNDSQQVSTKIGWQP